ncbi:MAG: L-2-amino-thiazoline-4-carboxylic acid hydrolase [Lachnospiraceae bacterium]|nr:L-2-amino-thiazoline-4-carboxylic acid hydrolase [Lachnospiraceae bacterium]
MKYKSVIWHFMKNRMKKGLPVCWPAGDIENLFRKAKPIYKELLSKMEGISDNNPMASNITMSFVIISVWLASDRKITPDQMSRVMKIALDWKLMKAFAGSIDLNTEKGIKSFGKMMKKNADWASGHPEDSNTWDFNFDESLHKDGFYYHFTHCPIASFCNKYGYEEINPVLCDIDHVTMAMMHSKLIREHTVAEGAGICDYWVVGDKIINPK